MLYTVETTARDFEYWGGAKDRINALYDIDYESREIVFELIEQYAENNNICGDLPTETEINDFVWFYLDDLLHDGFIEIWAKLYPSDYEREIRHRFERFVSPIAADVLARDYPELIRVADEFERRVIFGGFACLSVMSEAELSDLLDWLEQDEDEFEETGGYIIRDKNIDGVLVVCD